jgi:hypothetical protein
MPTALEQEIGHGNTGLTPWSAFVDVTETVPELPWPNSINTYSAMRTDAQIASLLLAFTLPIRRYRWYIAPNGARDQVVEDVATDFNLPIEGQDPKPITRRRDRFSHDRHLFHALLMIVYGFSFFEQVYRFGEASSRSDSASWRLVGQGQSPRFRLLAMAGLSTSANTPPVRIRCQDHLDRFAIVQDSGRSIGRLCQ